MTLGALNWPLTTCAVERALLIISALRMAHASSRHWSGFFGVWVESERIIYRTLWTLRATNSIVWQFLQSDVRDFDLPCLALPFLFPHYLINGTILGKTFIERKMCVWFFVRSFAKAYLILRRIQRDTAINVY